LKIILSTIACKLMFECEIAGKLETNVQKYLPAINDTVVGIVKAFRSNAYVVDIGTTSTAALSLFTFEGAREQLSPNFLVGSVICARVVNLSLAGEPILSCKNINGLAHDLGIIRHGYLFWCRFHVLQELMSGGGVSAMSRLGDAIPFEGVLGNNGYLWISASKKKNIILAVRALLGK
jgi:exosome complex RNA-binding protein Rrp4